MFGRINFLWNGNVSRGLSFLAEVLILWLYFCNLHLNLKAKAKITKSVIFIFHIKYILGFFPTKNQLNFQNEGYLTCIGQKTNFVSVKTYVYKGQIFSSYLSSSLCLSQKKKGKIGCNSWKFCVIFRKIWLISLFQIRWNKDLT